jgi:hypothetical protein
MVPIYITDGEVRTYQRVETFQSKLAGLRDEIKAEERFSPQNRKLPITPGQRDLIGSLFSQYLGGTGKRFRERKLKILSFILGEGVETTNDLTKWQVSRIIDILKVKKEGVYQISKLGWRFLECCETVIKGGDPYSEEFESGSNSVSAMDDGFGDTDLPDMQKADIPKVHSGWRERLRGA